MDMNKMKIQVQLTSIFRESCNVIMFCKLLLVNLCIPSSILGSIDEIRDVPKINPK